jgi:hypothetical protein
MEDNATNAASGEETPEMTPVEAKKAEYADKIAEWKMQNLKVSAFAAPGDEENEIKICFLRQPTEFEMSRCELASNGDPMKRDKLFLNTIWLDGDRCFVDDIRYFVPLQQFLALTIQAKYVELVKL